MLILCTGMFTGMASAGPTDLVDIRTYQWKNRLLFLFAPSEEDPSYRLLRKEIDRQAKGVEDRDLLVFHILEKGVSRLGTEPLSSAQVLSLKKHLSAFPGKFMIILIGKDGGGKLRQDRLVDLKEIFGIIDAMPMRQQEMRERTK